MPLRALGPQPSASAYSATPTWPPLSLIVPPARLNYTDAGPSAPRAVTVPLVTPDASNAFGVDIGGSGIKGAPVDLGRGAFAAERLRIPTPRPATPEEVARVVADVTTHFGSPPRFGATFPGVVQNGVVRTAANVDSAWLDTDAAQTFGKATGAEVFVLNDADAAGLAEARYGAAKDQRGVVVLVTFGTGIGSALLLDGRLVPNTELGHLEIDRRDAETRASDAARERDDLDWERWAKRVSRYLRHLEALLWPDMIICGGGVSKKANQWMPLLQKVRTQVVPAALVNDAGIIGAALWAQEHIGSVR
jgi:polyphosphate glucokinase